MKKKLFALSGLFLVVLVISGLWATKAINLTGTEQTIEPGSTSLANGLSMQEMTEKSSLIVTGKCLETKSQWIDRRLVTLATVSVTETIKGDSSPELTVVLPGGVDSNRRFPIAMTYAGAPQIASDEEVFLFLTGQDEVPGAHAVMGFAQGKYSIGEGEQEKVVTRDLSKVRLQKGMGTVRGNIQAVPLSEFKEKVKSYLR